MRTKDITIEGQKFTIAPLNTEQVETLIEVDLKDPKALRESRYGVVVQGLNNPMPAAVDRDSKLRAWDRERVRKELDWPTFNALYAEICNFTGLKTVEVKTEQGAAAGEAPAAPVTPATIN